MYIHLILSIHLFICLFLAILFSHMIYCNYLFSILYLHTYLYIYIHTGLYMCVYIYIYTHVCTHTRDTYTYTYIHIYRAKYMYTCVHVCICACTHYMSKMCIETFTQIRFCVYSLGCSTKLLVFLRVFGFMHSGMYLYFPAPGKQCLDTMCGGLGV